MRYIKKRIDDVVLMAIRPNPICDFCGDVSPAYVYAASRMSTGVFANCWRWTACEVCSVFVDTDNWHQIEERLTIKFKPLLRSDLSEEMIRQVVRLAVKEFHKYAVKDGT